MRGHLGGGGCVPTGEAVGDVWCDQSFYELLSVVLFNLFQCGDGGEGTLLHKGGEFPFIARAHVSDGVPVGLGGDISDIGGG